MAIPVKVEKELMAYVTEVRTFLRMDNWDVLLMDEKGEELDDDVFASTVQSTNHDSTQIWFGKEFWEQDNETKTNTIVHEMIHALHRDVSLLWDACTKNNTNISTDDAMTWDIDFKMYMERFVSNMTRLLAPRAPQWPTSSKDIGSGVRVIRR